MAIDPSITMVEVTGQYLDYEGNPIVGQIKFSLPEMLRNSLANQMIVPSTITVDFDTNGEFDITIPSTDDPDLIPEFLYSVEESFAYGRTYTLELPYTTTGSLDMADISPVPASPAEYYSMILRVPWDALVARINALAAQVDPLTNALTLSGQYAYINAAFASYTALNAEFASYTLLNAGPYEVTPAELSYWTDRTSAAVSTTDASVSTATTLVSGILNPMLLIGG